MDKKSQKLMNRIITFCLASTLLTTLVSNPGYVSRLLPLSVLLLLSFSIRRLFMVRSGFYRTLAGATFVLDILLVYFIAMMDMSKVSEIYFYVLIIDSILCYSLKFSLFGGFVIYLSYLFVRFMRFIKWNTFDFKYFSPALYENALYFILIFLIVYIAKRQFTQSQILSSTMAELEIKTEKLVETNLKLQHSLKELENMTAINERNRIAREIHDTVGHTLTTVLIEIEAGKRLILRNSELAVDKLNLAQGQVRKGLDDIRLSVRALKEGNNILSLIPSIQSLIRETERHTNVKIDFAFDSDLTLSEAQGKVLFSALQEGLTNGIRHGQCSAFTFSLKRAMEHTLFMLKDNGLGCRKISFGFGLTAMKERVQALGGTLDMDSKEGQGFTLTIKLPLEEEALCEKDQSSCC